MGVLFMRAILLGAVAIVSAAPQECGDLAGPRREQGCMSYALAVAGSR
jgi:hypothetical protein